MAEYEDPHSKRSGILLQIRSKVPWSNGAEISHCRLSNRVFWIIQVRTLVSVCFINNADANRYLVDVKPKYPR